jgi:Zn-dependent protease
MTAAHIRYARSPASPAARFSGAAYLARVAGIHLAVNSGVLLIVTTLLAGLAVVRLPEAHPGRDPAVYLTEAAVTAVLFAFSVLIHELAHAWMVRAHHIDERTLIRWVFGRGQLDAGPRGHRVELAIATAGPMVSAFLGGAFGTVAGVMGVTGVDGLDISVAAYLGVANFALAAFSLSPAMPLDGGRALRAWIRMRTGDPCKASQTTARVGRWLGIALILLGVGLMLAGSVAGLWVAGTAWWLIHQASGDRARQTDGDTPCEPRSRGSVKA